MLCEQYTQNNGELQIIQGRQCAFHFKQNTAKHEAELFDCQGSLKSAFSPIEECQIKLHQVLLTSQMKSRVQNIIKVPIHDLGFTKRLSYYFSYYTNSFLEHIIALLCVNLNMCRSSTPKIDCRPVFEVLITYSG